MGKKYPLDFLLFIPIDCPLNDIRITHEFKSMLNLSDGSTIIFYLPDTNKFQILNSPGILLAIGGDAIGFEPNLVLNHSPDSLKVGDFLRDIPGHYYLFQFDKKDKKLIVTSALFSIFPIFWYKCNKYILISSRLHLISDFLPIAVKPNKRYLIEQTLFNYSLFNETILDEVKLCPSNHYMEIKDRKLNFVKHLEIANLYVEKPVKWRNSAEKLTSLFIERFKDYTTDEKSIFSFTGGFDGRTLVACAKYFQKTFTTFSLGTKINDDIFVPMKNADELGLPYIPYFLDEKEYIEKEFYETGKELIDLTSSMSNYLYVHFLYAAKKISFESRYLYVGYFGSELFRALHLSGAVNSKELIAFFREDKEDNWINEIKSSPKLDVLQKGYYSHEIDEVIEDLRKYKTINKNKLTSLNKFFYQYVMEEIFRKVFGPHVYSQSNYINVRTPFLDVKFIKELFKSEIAGVNNDFFTHNPIKRIKGQYLYAKIIQRTYPELAFIKMQKGYSPMDLLTLMGKFNILLPYFIKKTQRKIEKPNLDNLSIISGLKFNWTKFTKQLLSDLYNVEVLNNLAEDIENISEYKRDLLALSVSSSMYFY